MTEPIVLEFQHTLQDYLGTQAWHANRLFSGTALSLFLCALLLGIGVLALTSGASLIWAWMAFIPAVVLGLLTAIKPFVYRSIWRNAAVFHHPIRLEFTAAGIHVQGKGVDSQLAWSYYSKWAESPTHLLLYQSRHIFSFIPKAGLGEPLLESLRERFRHHYGEAR